MTEQQQRQIDRDLEYIQARCRANAEIAREDPDQRRRTVSVQMRTAAQNGKSVDDYEREQVESADWAGAMGVA